MNNSNNISICHSDLDGNIITCNKNFINLLKIDENVINQDDESSLTGQYNLQNENINIYNLSSDEYKFSDENHKKMLLKIKAYGPYQKEIINKKNQKIIVIWNSIIMDDNTIWHSFELVNDDLDFQDNNKLKILNYLNTLKNKNLSYNKILLKILEYGNKIFKMDYSIISHIRDKEYLIEYCVVPDEVQLNKGDKFRLEDTCCVLCYNKEDTVVSFNNCYTSKYKNIRCNNIFSIKSYIGTTIYYKGIPYGVISFSSKKIREKKFTKNDKQFILLLSNFISDSYINELFKKKEAKYLENIESACSLLKKDKIKYNQLLKNLLPQYALDELNNNYNLLNNNSDLNKKINLIDNYHNNCVILFLNLTDFGEWISKDKPTSEKVIKYLHKYFSEFDKLSKKCNLEKIRSIGNTYLLVGGLNTFRTQSNNIIKFAKNTILKIKELNRKYFLNFKCRIGINKGNLISGIVGKFRIGYDIYGKSVNKAKRIEQICPENKILVSNSFYKINKRNHKFKRFKNKINKRNKKEKFYILVDR